MLLQIENQDSGFRVKTSLEEQTFLLGAYSYSSESTLLTDLFQNTFPNVDYIDEGDWEYSIPLNSESNLKSNDALLAQKLNESLINDFREDVTRFENALSSKNKFRYHQKTALEEFKLPNPKNNPNLYRICSIKSQNPRLQILWNLASDDPNEMISPAQALSILEQLLAQKKSQRNTRKLIVSSIIICTIALLYFSKNFLQNIGNAPLIDSVESVEALNTQYLRIDKKQGVEYHLGQNIIASASQSEGSVILLFSKPGAHTLSLYDENSVLVEQRKWNAYGVHNHPYKYPYVHYLKTTNTLHFSKTYFSEPDHPDNRVYLLNPSTQVYEEIDYKLPWEIAYQPEKIIAVDGNQNWHEIHFEPEKRLRPIAIAKMGGLRKLESEYLVSILDSGSVDPNGFIVRSEISWGDGTVSEFSGLPAEPVFHKYTQSADSRYIQFNVYDNDENPALRPFILLFDPNDIDTYESNSLQAADDEQVTLFRFFPLTGPNGETQAHLQVYANQSEKTILFKINPVLKDDYMLIEDIEIRLTDRNRKDEVVIKNNLLFKIHAKASFDLTIKYTFNGTPIELNPFLVDNEFVQSME